MSALPKFAPRWWRVARFEPHVHREYGSWRRHYCGPRFVVGVDSRGRFNMGWLRSGAERHSAYCDEISRIAEYFQVPRPEAERARSRWLREIRRERRTNGAPGPE